MFFQIDNVLLTTEILTERFCCDLDACKGECCVEGDAGAPVTLDEVAAIEESLDVVTLKPNRIVYISCNPDSLCRDLNVFDQNGYECQIIQPVDMFCYTTGIENIALLVKK